jgi:hypothetical protein
MDRLLRIILQFYLKYHQYNYQQSKFTVPDSFSDTTLRSGLIAKKYLQTIFYIFSQKTIPQYYKPTIFDLLLNASPRQSLRNEK